MSSVCLAYNVYNKVLEAVTGRKRDGPGDWAPHPSFPNRVNKFRNVHADPVGQRILDPAKF